MPYDVQHRFSSCLPWGGLGNTKMRPPVSQLYVEIAEDQQEGYQQQPEKFGIFKKHHSFPPSFGSTGGSTGSPTGPVPELTSVPEPVEGVEGAWYVEVTNLTANGTAAAFS